MDESNPKSWAASAETTEKPLFYFDFIGPIGRNCSFDADEVQQNSWNYPYKSLNTSFSLLRR